MYKKIAIVALATITSALSGTKAGHVHYKFTPTLANLSTNALTHKKAAQGTPPVQALQSGTFALAVYLRRLATVSVGLAPLAIQASIASFFNSTLAGF